MNPLALEEFAALEQRHKFLTEQLADLTATRKDLLTIIDEIDEKMQDIFASAFEDTKAAFNQVFPVLFPGGTGSLHLTDPDELLTTGIEVTVRPAGKKIERLSLLSGGERSLAAVALLIAIFKARPSPFYILDEVEAALDDANLGRLLSILQDLRTNSQLIVITHQKRTMEIADALYGVSMRQDGVSAVVGQRVAPRRRRADPRASPGASLRCRHAFAGARHLRRPLRLILVALSVGVAAPASADEADCAPTYLAQQRPRAVRDRRRLPPARAPRLPGRLRVADLRRAVRRRHRHLVRLRAALRRRRLRRVHRHPAGVRARRLDRRLASRRRSTPTRRALNESATTAQLEALPQPPLLARSRFSSPTGLDLVAMTYASNGQALDGTLTAPASRSRCSRTSASAATRINDPSVLSGLRTFFRGGADPAQTGVIAGGAVVLMLVIGWPANLLNSFVGTRYDGLVRWLQSRFRRKKKDAPDAARRSRRGCPAG